MKPSTKNQTEGVYHEAKGKIKETVGKIIDKPSLEAEGLAEKVAGKVQKKVGEVEKVLEE
ncbi:CsbD family protein [Desulfomicrobium sp. ZS1]|uniref:CsbD family protein n=1 Tax=Desulfomicrobium sp. ZS1 TaxID=2952228 RepID=UPI0020B31D35|nr:CsbD family protein [Desulfomicrobium sp. ZS1]UTF50733.1 CsbD family protein [Desulfomicrobium sp. ZS1]